MIKIKRWISPRLQSLKPTLVGQKASNAIMDLLENPNPVLIARIGSNELGTMATHLSDEQNRRAFGKLSQFLLGRFFKKFWRLRWSADLCERMQLQAGFFPSNPTTLKAFAQIMLDCACEIDLYAAWRHEEDYLAAYLKRKNPTVIPLNDLAPFIHNVPWSKCLSGKRVLVLHPFSDSIERNFKNLRDRLFDNPLTLPDFELQTIKAIQTSAGGITTHSSWFSALNEMKDKMSSREFDIAIIGAGAYGLPLAHHAMKLGKKGIHLGGITQLLFGIIGTRWETDPVFRDFPNDYWTRPLADERPPRANEVENGCYW